MAQEDRDAVSTHIKSGLAVAYRDQLGEDSAMTRIKRRFGEGKFDQVYLPLGQQNFFAFLGREGSNRQTGEVPGGAQRWAVSR